MVPKMNAAFKNILYNDFNISLGFLERFLRNNIVCNGLIVIC